MRETVTWRVMFSLRVLGRATKMGVLPIPSRQGGTLDSGHVCLINSDRAASGGAPARPWKPEKPLTAQGEGSARHNILSAYTHLKQASLGAIIPCFDVVF